MTVSHHTLEHTRAKSSPGRYSPAQGQRELAATHTELLAKLLSEHKLVSPGRATALPIGTSLHVYMSLLLLTISMKSFCNRGKRVTGFVPSEFWKHRLVLVHVSFFASPDEAHPSLHVHTSLVHTQHNYCPNCWSLEVAGS